MVDLSAKTADRMLAPPLVPVETVIDLDHLGRMTLGEKSLEREVLHLFDRQAGMLLARMQAAPPPVIGKAASLPVATSMSCAVIRTRAPLLRTLPSTT